MAMIGVVCPNCRQTLRVPDRYLGNRVKCKYCEQPFVVEVLDNSVPPGGADDGPMDLPPDDIFEQQTIAGPAPSFAPPPPPYVPAPAPHPRPAPAPAYTAPAPRRPSGPPPLPPRQESGGKIKVGSLLVSLVSLAVICGSSAGIYTILRSPKKDDIAQASHGRHAAVAIESGGVRLIGVDLDKEGDSYDWNILARENEDIKIGDVPDGTQFDPKKLDATAEAVKRYVELCKKNDVPPESIAVVCNSGVLRGFKTDAARDKGKAALDDAIRSACGITPAHITVEDEARFGALGCLPIKERLSAVHVDVGSNNIKLGFFTDDDRFKALDVDYGTRKFGNDIAALQKTRFKLSQADAAAQIKPEKVNAPIRALTKDWPALVNRDRYYVVGGASWVVAALTHPVEQVERARVVLTPEDIAAFNDLVCAPGQTMDGVKAAVLAKLPAGASREKVEKETRRILDIFRLDYLISAGKILQAFSEECQFKTKTVKFFTYSLHAWPLGYILVRSKLEQ